MKTNKTVRRESFGTVERWEMSDKRSFYFYDEIASNIFRHIQTHTYWPFLSNTYWMKENWNDRADRLRHFKKSKLVLFIPLLALRKFSSVFNFYNLKWSLHSNLFKVAVAVTWKRKLRIEIFIKNNLHKYSYLSKWKQTPHNLASKWSLAGFHQVPYRHSYHGHDHYGMRQNPCIWCSRKSTWQCWMVQGFSVLSY